MMVDRVFDNTKKKVEGVVLIYTLDAATAVGI